MKAQLIAIFGGHYAPEATLKEILALATPSDESDGLVADSPALLAEARLTALATLQKVIDAIGELKTAEIVIHPLVLVGICAELKERTMAFMRAESMAMAAGE